MRGYRCDQCEQWFSDAPTLTITKAAPSPPHKPPAPTELCSSNCLVLYALGRITKWIVGDFDWGALDVAVGAAHAAKVEHDEWEADYRRQELARLTAGES